MHSAYSVLSVGSPKCSKSKLPLLHLSWTERFAGSAPFAIESSAFPGVMFSHVSSGVAVKTQPSSASQVSVVQRESSSQSESFGTGVQTLATHSSSVHATPSSVHGVPSAAGDPVQAPAEQE